MYLAGLRIPDEDVRELIKLVDEPTRSLYAADYAERHELPAKPALQRAIGALVTKEIAGRDESRVYRIVEPFFADWLRTEQAI